MNGRATAAAAAAVALALIAQPSVAAVTDVDDSSISLQAPKTAKPGKKFEVSADITFDHADIPPYAYLAAGVWQHQGDDRCPKAVPMDSSGEDKPGWNELYQGTWYPEDDADYSYGWRTFVKRTSGTYRWCGYVYTIQSDGTMFGEAYRPVARAQAKTTVKN